MNDYKEIDECVKELNGMYDKLLNHYCEDSNRICAECVLADEDHDCVLNNLQDLINKLEEKQL